MRTTQLLLAVGLWSLAASAPAGTVIYTDEAQFVAQTQPGYDRETFTALSDGPMKSPLTFSNNGFAYRAESLGDFFVQSQPPVKWLSDGLIAGDVIKIDFTSGNVTAVGGRFFNTDASRNLAVPSVFFLALDDGTSVMINDPTPTTFLGFISTTPISSLLLTPDPKFYASFTDFIVGAGDVPEPSSLTLAGIAALLGLGYGWSKRPCTRGSGDNRGTPDPGTWKGDRGAPWRLRRGGGSWR
jgi:hypothetical protein